ncbi:fungal-specific transcription factor domain-containing protein [Phyllosticta citrichinensis]|uniref:Fungal-specific transcription factor domain-containing protein n=1 Tax=Phyllosticta citrichinensis TaxID=1130410 RepID=A0ABR1XF86_9PEZI
MSQVSNESPSSLAMGLPSTNNTAAKVAIPPLRHRIRTPPVPTDKKRTAKACAECRSRKIKCSGMLPTCDHCELLQVPCLYNDGKRERHKKGLERGDRMLSLLRDISATVHLPANIRSKMMALESEVPDDNLSLASTASQKRLLPVGATASNKRPRSHSPGIERTGNPDAVTSADVGSQRSVDLVGEDLTQNEQTRATGFVGKVSEVAWAQGLAHVQNSHIRDDCDGQSVFGMAGDTERAELDRLNATRRRHAPDNGPRDRVSESNYHVDQEDVLLLYNVDKDELPTAEMATNICECYMEYVQGMFPALSKAEFVGQFEMFLVSRNPESLPAKCRAILNLIFAVGARFSHLSEAPWRGDERDHLIYYTRARHLGFNGETLLEDPDLQGIQVLALISFYYLAIGQVSRAWIMIGSACRHAVALGMHLRTEVPSIPYAQKEKRVRVWWSLHRLDHVLCEITGRPPAINHLFASVPIPAPLDEDNVSPALDRMNLDGRMKRDVTESKDVSMTICFRHHVLLGLIAQRVIVTLYSAENVTASWEAARNSIVGFSKDIDQWYMNLPPQFKFGQNSAPSTRERTLLGFSFYGTKILLNRPCLCRIDLRIRNIGEHSKVVNDERSRECIRAARNMANLLPNDAEPNVLWLYCNGPWWCIVHHLMQAITVFMLELAFGLCHMSEPKANRHAILPVLHKLIRWMEKMADMGNATARGACKQIREQFKGFASYKDDQIQNFARKVFSKQPSSRPGGGSPLATPRLSPWQSQSPDFDDQQHFMASESADYFGQFHRDHYGVSLNQAMHAHHTVEHHPHVDRAPLSNTISFPANAATSSFGAGPGEPWETNPDPTWSNLMWQTSHDQFNPFSNLASDPLLAQQQQRQQQQRQQQQMMDSAGALPSEHPHHAQYGAAVHVVSGQGMAMAAFAQDGWHIAHPNQLPFNAFSDPGDLDYPYDASSSM